MEATTDVSNGYMVYSIILGSPDMKFYNVIVDPGNGQSIIFISVVNDRWNDDDASRYAITVMDMMGMKNGWNNQDNGMKWDE